MTEECAITLPREFKDFRGYHQGKSILVCGCGSSLSKLIAPERSITIGVNDVGRLFDPDYLVVLNPPGQFAADRFSYVRRSRAKTVFTQLDLEIDHPHVVRFRLGKRGSADLSDPGALPYTRNSPYVAIALARHMGARRIGVIGVDFTENHFFAATGRHPLTGELHQIEAEYARLGASCRGAGTEVFNLSQESRLTAFPRMTQEDFFRRSLAPSSFAGRKLFFVNYEFKSCGHLFRDGLARAADDLQLNWQAAQWNDEQLPRRLAAFDPELLFVVHGRKFCQRWPFRFPRYRSAVWLLDEPYEVDDTTRFSSRFDLVFVNDPSTLGRHRNAHYLPVGYDPGLHTYSPGEDRPYTAGFIGGANAWREQALAGLVRRGFLSYVVGGPFASPVLKPICSSAGVPPEEAAALYRQSKIIVNLFRTQHHYNREAVVPVSLNPRVYEGLACGGLVISEYRSELDTLCPELPAFRTVQELEFQVERHLRDSDLFARVRKACIRRLALHSYSQRLDAALTAAFAADPTRREVIMVPDEPATADSTPATSAAAIPLPPELTPDWEALDTSVQPGPEGELSLRSNDGDATEQGLKGKHKLGNVILEFEVKLQADTRFIAKIHEEAHGRLGNSYHLMCKGPHGYLARHNRVFAKFHLPLGVWVPLTLLYMNGNIVLRRSGAEIARASDRMLETGCCFLGIIGGVAALRNISVRDPLHAAAMRTKIHVSNSQPVSATGSPTLSIVTTVYDRVDCLERCIQSVQALFFGDYEHIIVADCPPAETVARIRSLVARYSAGRSALHFSNLDARHNDWGISPAAAGLALARGKYVCFLSDDNGYLPQHFDKLVALLDRNQHLGFVYSSCLYAGRLVLNASTPGPARIDLGQPLFRRELFDQYLGGKLPFHELGWDWRVIQTFMSKGVRWQHVNEPTFIFRLAQYPHLIASHPPPPPRRPMISYCIACLRPVYARQLIDELINKTTLAAEILLWMNLSDPDFEHFVAARTAAGANIRIIGRTPQNIGMAAYWHLFKASAAEMVVQIDDDVVCISPRIAETAREVFQRFLNVGMLTADVWQDEYTTGARPPMQHYRAFDERHGLYDGPIDGWFAVYRKSSLALCNHIRPARYLALGASIKTQLESRGQAALLCTGMQVFHVTGPAYVSHFGMLESEISKYQEVGRDDMVAWYKNASLPPATELSTRVGLIRQRLTEAPAAAVR
jgi:hypothetical protein